MKKKPAARKTVARPKPPIKRRNPFPLPLDKRVRAKAIKIGSDGKVRVWL